MRIGVLALQGAFIEHVQALRQLGVGSCRAASAAGFGAALGRCCPAGRRKYGAGQAAA